LERRFLQQKRESRINKYLDKVIRPKAKKVLTKGFGLDPLVVLPECQPHDRTWSEILSYQVVPETKIVLLRILVRKDTAELQKSHETRALFFF